MNIIVVVNNHNSVAIVDLCEKLRQHDPSIEYLAVCDPELGSRYAESLKKRNCRIEYLGIATSAFVQEAKMRRSGKVRKAIKNHIQENARSKKKSLLCIAVKLFSTSTLGCAIMERLILSNLKAYKKWATKLLEDFQADIVLSMSDRSHDYVESAICWAAKARGAKILLPYVSNFDANSALLYRRDPSGRALPELDAFRALSLYKLSSYLRLRGQVFQQIFFQAPYILNAHRKSGTLSKYPWWVGNGLSDIVCVNSTYTARVYEKHRVPRNKIQIVGDVAYDSIHYCLKNKEPIKQVIIEKYRFEKSKKLIILSVPQWAEQNYISWEKHWYEINLLVREICSLAQNVLLSVHPRSDLKKYIFLEKEYECKISEEPLSEIVSAADLFVSSNSSTIVWSVLCGVPSIDYVSPAPPIYNYLTSICYVDSVTKLVPSIQELLGPKEISFEKDWELLGRDKVFDGLFCERFLGLLRSICPPCVES